MTYKTVFRQLRFTSSQNYGKIHKVRRLNIMARSSNQKLKLLYLIKIFREETDENHKLKMSAIIEKLAHFGIASERKAIYSDLELLQDFGYDIIYDDVSKDYYLGSREFEIPELKLLVDSVHSSRFVTEKKSYALIKKLESFTSVHSAHKLSRPLFLSDRIKASNETIYYNVDKLHEAIGINRKVTFRYFNYDLSKEKQFRNDGRFYTVSPYSLVYSEDNYYLICHYPQHDRLSHFRVDRMTDISITKEESENITKIMGNSFNLGKYSRSLFSMYAGNDGVVELICENSLINAVFDRFGLDVPIRKFDDNKFIATVHANIGPSFFAWVFMFDGKMNIHSSPETREKYLDMCKKSLDLI